ncbi:MAG: F-box protein, partial [Verrucomicrobia bacterium]|nr:F-box protein [Verrucomicrobiota bacterium]
MNPVHETNLSQLGAPQQKQNPSLGITDLPKELLEDIFKRLLPKNLSRMAQTSKTFREISITAFLEQKLQVQSFLKRILGTNIFTSEIEQHLVNSKNFKEFGKVIEDHICPIPCEVGKQFTRLLPEAIYKHTQLEDLSTIELLHEILELSPIFYLPNDFCTKIPQETSDRLVDMLIEKHELKDTFKIAKHFSTFHLFPYSRKLLQYAHGKHPEYINCASDRLKDDKEFILKMIEEWTQISGRSPNVCWAFRYASDRLKDDKDVVLAAVQKDGITLEVASDRLKEDKDVVLAALRSKLRLD